MVSNHMEIPFRNFSVQNQLIIQDISTEPGTEKNFEPAQIIRAELLFRGLAEELDESRRFPTVSAEPEKAVDTLTKLYKNGSVPAAKTLARLLLSDGKMRQNKSLLLRQSSAFSAEKMPEECHHDSI